MAVPDVTQKAEIYETMSSLNMAFAGIIEHLQAMRQNGTLTPKYTRLFQGFTQEVQAEINLQLLESLDGIESADWARFGMVRQKWEKYLKGPERKTSKR